MGQTNLSISSTFKQDEKAILESMKFFGPGLAIISNRYVCRALFNFLCNTIYDK